jgi:hypothetical protein
MAMPVHFVQDMSSEKLIKNDRLGRRASRCTQESHRLSKEKEVVAMPSRQIARRAGSVCAIDRMILVCRGRRMPACVAQSGQALRYVLSMTCRVADSIKSWRHGVPPTRSEAMAPPFRTAAS